MILTIVLVPLVIGSAIILFHWRQIGRWLLLAVAVIHSALVTFFWIKTPEDALSGWLGLDPLALFFLTILSFIFLLASVYNFGYLKMDDLLHKRRAHPSREYVYVGSLLLFLAAMSLATISQHLGLLWVAVEATTLASAALIFFHRTTQSLEATWKYLVICSVGIALALMGVFFLGAATAAAGENLPLVLKNLLQSGERMDSNWIRAAFIFFMVGYGTKMGLAPMHTWLPDAHSEAPSGASALLSGVLLNCAFLAILRSYQICLAAGAGLFARKILILFGIISMVLAAAFILYQTDYKRMLAYSSVEHMGILALGTGLGSGAAFFTLFHALNHSLTKSLLFFTSGNILMAFKTKKAAKIQGALQALPWSGIFWIAGFLAITGIPPFSLFISEFNLLGVMLKSDRWWLAVLYLLALVIVFIGMGRIVLNMSLGKTATENSFQENFWLVGPPLVLLALILILGLFIPDGLFQKIISGANLIGGAR